MNIVNKNGVSKMKIIYIY